MKTLMIVALSSAAVAMGVLSAWAGAELDRAMGAGSFIHPTGPANGVWHDDATTKSKP